MVIKMTRYDFVLLDKDLAPFLAQLQEWGVMDVRRSVRAADDATLAQLELTQRYKAAVRGLRNFNDKGIAKLEFMVPPEKFLETVEEHLAANVSLAAQKIELQKEKSAAEVWGKFDMQDIARLCEMDFVPHFHVVSEKKMDENWAKDYAMYELNRIRGKVYFVVLSRKGEEYGFPLTESKFPERSIDAVEVAIRENDADLERNRGELATLKTNAFNLEASGNEASAVLDRMLANDSAEKAVESRVALITGFAPAELDSALSEKLAACPVYFTSQEAVAEDNPPVKLKNNWFATLFEPIGNLYMLPRYGELDLTPYFAPFYMLFFGLCLGDMGYGLLLLLIGLFAVIKVPKLRDYGKLVMCLGIGSLVMPAMTGTFFGVSLYEKIPMPQGFYDLWYNPATINIKMFWFALIFGVFQIVCARLISAVHAFRAKGWQYGLANVGWAIFTVWAAIIFAEWQGGFAILSKIISYSMLIISGIFIVFFSKITSNVFKRLLGGVKAVYDVTGLLGDVLSYVRLFGLGAAGGILALVMNQIAFSLASIPYAGWLLCALMLIVGHCLVIFLSCLGAFVHPIRLTFVEFYKNADFQGGGRAYKPLKKSSHNS